jgi:hypothetical protein
MHFVRSWACKIWSRAYVISAVPQDLSKGFQIFISDIVLNQSPVPLLYPLMASSRIPVTPHIADNFNAESHSPRVMGPFLPH